MGVCPQCGAALIGPYETETTPVKATYKITYLPVLITVVMSSALVPRPLSLVSLVYLVAELDK